MFFSRREKTGFFSTKLSILYFYLFVVDKDIEIKTEPLDNENYDTPELKPDSSSHQLNRATSVCLSSD